MTVGRRRLAAVVLAALLAAACATAPQPAPAPGAPPPPATRPAEPAPPRPRTDAQPVASLPGWDQENHLAALYAYAQGCAVGREAPVLCEHAQAMTRAARLPTPSEARAFFEQNFDAIPATTPDGRPGLLTAYFAPEYPARRAWSPEFDAPVLARPADLERVDGRFMRRRPDGGTAPYADRAAIEAAARGDQALAWMRAEDLFFMQIQGSGYLTFEDGGRARAAYAADNGLAFTGIARPMSERGLLPANGTSGEAIRAWLAAHRGEEARAVMALNPRYIFFRMDPDDGGQPSGAAGVPLTERRAIAVDPASWRYGDAVWVEADGGDLVGARASYRGLVMALDTGSAIRGPVRADLYLGRGEAAGLEAGAVRHPLRMWRLAPKTN
ncbi:MAG: MltA domain-containing protein [Brevundimonas sp.]|uniref:MltA domain-containing protein n=1 Tax=Brevundimonas sp. TaxID=1871086 RepID=UPI0025BA2666|nr:MltA domain-containing protein [Brevundimonas sp.]MBX3478133.1 MltA domain-containing protein [Brevundimonas sp.]